MHEGALRIRNVHRTFPNPLLQQLDRSPAFGGFPRIPNLTPIVRRQIAPAADLDSRLRNRTLSCSIPCGVEPGTLAHRVDRRCLPEYAGIASSTAAAKDNRRAGIVS